MTSDSLNIMANVPNAFWHGTLPKGYVRIRHFGLLGSRLKKEKTAIVRRLKGVVQVVKEKVQLSWQELLKNLTGIDVALCPKCGSSNLRIGSPTIALNTS